MQMPTFGGSVEADGVGDSSAKVGIELICPETIEHQTIIIKEKERRKSTRIRIYEAIGSLPV